MGNESESFYLEREKEFEFRIEQLETQLHQSELLVLQFKENISELSKDKEQSGNLEKEVESRSVQILNLTTQQNIMIQEKTEINVILQQTTLKLQEAISGKDHLQTDIRKLQNDYEEMKKTYGSQLKEKDSELLREKERKDKLEETMQILQKDHESMENKESSASEELSRCTSMIIEQ